MFYKFNFTIFGNKIYKDNDLHNLYNNMNIPDHIILQLKAFFMSDMKQYS